MDRAAEYRANADKCRVLARRLDSDDPQIAALLKMAESWDRLVDVEERRAKDPRTDFF